MQLAAMRLMAGPAATPAGEDSPPAEQQPAATGAGTAAPAPSPTPAMPPPAEIDPVCGMKVTDFDQARADGLLTEYQGKTYWFCSADCKEQFERNPQGFLDKAGMSGAQQPEAHMHSSPQMQMSPPESQPATPADQHGDHAASMRMPAPADAPPAEIDPVCGMKVTDFDQARADGLLTEYQGKTYWFCSDDCKEQFERNPQGFLDKAGMSGAQQPEAHMHSSPQMQMSPPESQPAAPAPPADQHGDHAASMPMPAPTEVQFAEIDPVCGMQVTDLDQARADGLITEYQGKTYWFCSVDCKEQFERNPQGFLDKAGQSAPPQGTIDHSGHGHD
ncbi:MAG: YHS domain-containing protein [Desulfobulbaceae bacterium]|nr:MAG: YHS domain-containing protein [Desulfobulbaceae bacterium]